MNGGILLLTKTLKRLTSSVRSSESILKPFTKGTKKTFSKAIALGMTAALLLSPLQGLGLVTKAAENTTALTDSDLAVAYSKTSVNRVSVHDPSIISDGKGTYYIFGSHMAWAKSTDLKNWTPFRNNINSDYATLFAKEIAWARMGDTAYDPSGNMWAPDVVFNKDLNKWCMYMSINGWSWNSSIAMLTADTLDGDWTYAGTVIYSGFTEAANNHDFSVTDYTAVTGDTTLANRYKRASYISATSTTTWNYDIGAHAIDPGVFYSQDGKLYMTYGSWSGGIYIIELDETTGLRDRTVTYNYVANTSDPYMGIKLAGGYMSSGEAPYIEYINGYYYLFVTNGWLEAKGGYNMRVYKSTNPTGPYTDISGQSPNYTRNINNTNNDVGTRLMSYYKWNYQQYAQVAQGHNSAIVDTNGKAYVVYHTRSNDGTEGHSVRVHQLFTTKNKHLVAAPFEYDGETVSQTGYGLADVIGEYEVILQKHSVDHANLQYNKGEAVKLNEDGTISGDYTGTWAMEADSPYVTMTIGGITYEGLFVEQTVEETNVKAMAFTLVGTNDVCFWGAKTSAAAAIAMTRDSISVPSETFSDINLTTTGSFGASVSWTSSNTNIIESNGKVTAPAVDTSVTLTATISRDGKAYQKSFNVLVRKAVANFNEIQLISSAFVNDPQDLSTRLDGSLSMANPYRSISNLDITKGVKIKFDVESTGTNNLVATILSFMGNEGASGRLYFTPGSYLGYNATGGWFDANINDWAIATDYINNTKATVEISFTETSFQVDINGVKAYDQHILSNPETGRGPLRDYYNVLNWLTTTADKVYFGSGAWWKDQAALCTISNVYFYAYLAPDYNVTRKLIDESGLQQIASVFVNDPQNLSTKLDGRLSIPNPYRYITNLDISKGAKVKFDVLSTGTNRVLATILSFMGNDGANGRLYFTPGSYLGYNATGGWFDANMHDYRIVTDYIGDSRATVEIFLTSTGFQVDVNGVKAYDQSVLGNPAKGTGTLTDFNNVLNWLANTADKVYFGKGSWWGAAGWDEALATISDVYFYGYAQEGSAPTVTLSESTVIYDGTAKMPAVTVKDGDTTLAAGADYTVEYSNNTNVGTATVTITGTGNYLGTITKTFEINAKEASTLTVTLGTSSYTYDGTAKTPTSTVKDGETTLAEGTDYTVEYTNNINVGTATVTITGKGNYTGTTAKTFTINAYVPPAPTTPEIPNKTSAANTSPEVVIGAISGVASNGKVTVDVTANKSVAKEIFDAIKGTDKTVTFTQNGIEWSFSGKDITNSTKTIDMTVNVAKLVDTTTDNKTEIQNNVKDKDVVVISFASNGQLPGKAGVRVKLDAAWLADKNKNNINIYYFNKTTKAMETIASGLVVDAEGYVAFEITHNSDYVVSDQDLTKTETTPTEPKTPTAPAAPTTIRLGGANRYETSVKISQAGWATADNVVLARGDEFADALTAAPFAKQLNAPILLTGTKALDSSIAAELKRLKTKKVYIIGGTGAISAAVENAVKALGITVERISGSDRYATSLAIANRMTNKSQVFLVTGTNYADALSISSYAAATGSPILLTAKNQMTAGVAKFIKDNKSKVYVIGGTGVISETAVKGIAGAERIAGADRYATNLAVLNKFAAGYNFKNIYLATGDNYPDAICGSALAGKESAPIVLVNSSNTANQKTYIKSVIAKVTKVNVLGGQGVLTTQTIANIID